MTRKVQSQWEFGELFPMEPTRKILTVSELTGQIRRVLEKEMAQVWVTGEVTNLRTQSSGHIYFTLKDAGSQLNCVLFRSELVPHREYLEDGQKLLLQGTLTVYEPRGQYQLIVRALELQGQGALQIAFERLKRKLAAEGLFDPTRKRPLPRYPQRIGLVTSPTGAAIRDVLHVVARRQPGLIVILAPCRVQGEGAAAEVAAAIGLLNQWNQAQAAATRLDLILVTRGGGSLEDLWTFNEEPVARAVFQSALPIVSAVGHEIDFTICDFVADVRAATPSAAAEIITEGTHASRRFVAESGRRLRQLAGQRVQAGTEQVRSLGGRLRRVHPRRRLQEHLQHLDELQFALGRTLKQGWRLRKSAWLQQARRLARLKPSLVLAQRRQAILQSLRRLREQVALELRQRRNRLDKTQARLQLLGPDNVLARGYSITTDEATGKILRKSDETQAGRELRTRLGTGEVRSVVVEPEAAKSARRSTKTADQD